MSAKALIRHVLLHTRQRAEQAVMAKRVSLADRRAAKEAKKKPRTRPVPHPFLLPVITVE